jgi:hypothetical protein
MHRFRETLREALEHRSTTSGCEFLVLHRPRPGPARREGPSETARAIEVVSGTGRNRAVSRLPTGREAGKLQEPTPPEAGRKPALWKERRFCFGGDEKEHYPV